MADLQSVLSNSFLKDRSDLLVAIGVIAVVMMLIIPIPSVLLDVFMAFNLVLALLVILIVMYTKKALEFSVFPTLLLVSTVFGLALNVSSTRLILAQGSKFDGRIVRAFASFVVGTGGTEGMVIGMIIFIIIIAVQFIVITKGATRVAEVAARFTLDAMPQKQMQIETEFSSGVITEIEASQKRQDLQREVDFYGAMDGASKFVSGNVKVGILITVINIIGGMIVGMTLHNETLEVAVNTYIILTIGDGLVSQFPALLISTATGIIVTRAVSTGSFGKDIVGQFSNVSRIYWIAAAFLVVMAFLPGFPMHVLLPMGAVTGWVAYRLSVKQQQESAEGAKTAAAGQAKAEQPAEISPVVPLDPISLELGYGLIPLVDKDQGAELLERVTRIRKEAALEIGLVVPRIRIMDNMRLEPSEYCVKIKGVEVGRGVLRMGSYMAINPGGEREPIQGEETKDPAFGLPAQWVSEQNRERAERMGYTVVDPPSVIATHLTEILKKHANEILGRQELQVILDTLKGTYPAVVEEITKTFGLGEIQKVLQALLREQVSIRNMVVILETMADYGPMTKDTGFLVEKVRQALGRQLCLQFANEDRTIPVLTLSPKLEQLIIDARLETAAGIVAALKPDVQRRWINALANSVRGVQEKGFHPVILCSEAARPLVKSSSLREIPDLVVLSVPEIIPDVRIESLGEIRLE